MATFLGGNAADTFKLGASQVDKVYQGSTLVYENAPVVVAGIAVATPLDFVTSNTITATSTSGFTVDWGDGTPISYLAGLDITASAIASGDIIVDGVDITELSFNTNTYGTINIVDGTTLTAIQDICNGLTNLTSFNATNTQNVTGLERAWLGCTGLTSFPLIDTSSVSSVTQAWFGCTGLTSFPLLDTSSVTTAVQAWKDCSGLTSFPLLDTSKLTAFGGTGSGSWDGCSGLTSFPLIDASSATVVSRAWLGCSSLTSFPAIDFSQATTFDRTWDGCVNLTCMQQINTLAATGITSTMFDNTPALINPSTSEQTDIINGSIYVNSNPCGSVTTITPPNLAAIPGANNTELVISWDASVGSDNPIVGYVVYRDRDTIVYEGALLTATDTGLLAAFSYNYTVNAIDSLGNISPLSSIVVGTTSGTAVLPPTGLAVAAGANNQTLDISWDASVGSETPITYNLFRDGSLVQSGVSALTFSDTGLLAGTTYTYTVSATDNQLITSALTAGIVGTTTGTEVGPPTGLVVFAGAITDTELDLSWNASVGSETPITYNVYRDGSLIQSGATALTFSDTGLFVGTTYTYTVSATDNQPRTSALSAGIVGTTTGTAVLPPTGLAVVAGAITDTELDISWDASVGSETPITYNVFRNGILVQSGATALTFSDTGLSTGSTYTYTVSATDAQPVESTQSAGVDGTTTGATALKELIQVAGVGSTGLVLSETIDATTGWATPTSGNLLVATCAGRSDWWFATPAGWNLSFAKNLSFDSGALFWKISDGTESSVTFTRQSNSNRLINVHMFEVKNATGIVQYVEGTNPPRTLVGTTADNLIIGFGWAYIGTTSSWVAPLVENLYVNSSDDSISSDFISTGGDIVGNYTYTGNNRTTIIVEVA